MPKTKISEFDVNPDNNTDINSINIAEGCAPSGINNAIRQLMSDLKEFQTGAGGDPFNGAVNGTVGATTPASGAFTTLSASGAFSANGGATLGDASGDALTINSSAVSIPNGLNFGSNNLVLSSGNVGIGTSSPLGKLHSSSASFGGTVSSNANQVVAENSGNAGITIASGASSLGNIFFADSGDTADGFVQYDQSGRSMRFGTATAERMRIDSSGNVGIGTSSPSKKLDIVTPSGTYEGLQVTAGGNHPSLARFIGGGGGSVDFGSDSLASTAIIRTAGTERMRIDSSGNLLVGKTTSSSSTDGLILYGQSTISGYGRIDFGKTVSGTVTGLEFANSGTPVGTITYSNTATAYNTSSDYRLKENIAPMAGALDVVQQLKPVTYNWKADGSSGQGFIAHELQAVVPDCVTGEKDAVETYTDEDGVEQIRPKYQGIDTSFLVATLTAAIQEQQAIITDLKSRIETLEAK